MSGDLPPADVSAINAQAGSPPPNSMTGEENMRPSSPEDDKVLLAQQQTLAEAQVVQAARAQAAAPQPIAQQRIDGKCWVRKLDTKKSNKPYYFTIEDRKPQWHEPPGWNATPPSAEIAGQIVHTQGKAKAETGEQVAVENRSAAEDQFVPNVEPADVPSVRLADAADDASVNIAQKEAADAAAKYISAQKDAARANVAASASPPAAELETKDAAAAELTDELSESKETSGNGAPVRAGLGAAAEGQSLHQVKRSEQLLQGAKGEDMHIAAASALGEKALPGRDLDIEEDGTVYYIGHNTQTTTTPAATPTTTTPAATPPTTTPAATPTLEESAVAHGVTLFLSSFEGHPHKGLATRVQGICDTVGLQLKVVDFVDSPALRPQVCCPSTEQID